jgi:purine-nucleoside phosphorylase
MGSPHANTDDRLVLPFTALVEAVQAEPPEVALILGSGMGPVTQRLDQAQSLPFTEVPELGATSVVGHHGQLLLGEWAGKRMLIFEGRLHFYEGHPWRNVVMPVQLARLFGARVLLMTNAAGGIHDALTPGSLMVLRDHIEWTRPHSWRQPGPGALGPGRPSPYSPRLVRLFLQAGHTLGMEIHQGIYASVTGPNYETPAEIRALRAWGADAVGMSTAREAQVAFEAGMECAVLSCITNRAAGLGNGTINHAEVLTTAATQNDRLADLLQTFLQML